MKYKILKNSSKKSTAKLKSATEDLLFESVVGISVWGWNRAMSCELRMHSHSPALKLRHPTTVHPWPTLISPAMSANTTPQGNPLPGALQQLGTGQGYGHRAPEGGEEENGVEMITKN